MLQDSQLMAAVSRIVQRSERQGDIQKLLKTYVEIGLLPQLNNVNHQIFYGRRGTGKTHLLKVLESELKKTTKNTVVYIDCRTLGSTSQFSDTSIPIPKRCLSLFRDILNNIYSSLLEHIVEDPNDQANQAIDHLDLLLLTISNPTQNITVERLTTQEEITRENKRGIGLTANLPSAQLGATANRENKNSDTKNRNVEYSINTEDKIVFPDLHQKLNQVLDLGNTDLYILIDEWADLPRDIQPYLAEFLKRGVLPVKSATVKISALEYRCQFNYRHETRIVGFELGADISTATDLDDYFVFDRNQEQIVQIYGDILFRHLESELPKEYLKHEHMINSGESLTTRLFTERKTFVELARASEGVIRDLINIFTKSYFNAQKRGRSSIDKKAITESAQQWFEQDKSQYLDDHLQSALQRIVTEVIGNKKARAFLLPRQLERHPVIQGLFDARVLHHMQRGYADKDNPGVRYNIYSIDYGTYVDLLGTSKEPQLEMKFLQEGTDETNNISSDKEVVVPFDDKRSIRRIVLWPEVLE